MITIQTENDPALDQINSVIVEAIAFYLFSAFKVSDGTITYIFASDEYVSDLKKKFFQVEQFTDVIAFRLNEEEDLEGEVYISLPRAKENADKFEEPYKKEIARLIIHGSLHLMGFDDQSEEEKEEMRSMEDHYLTFADWKNIIQEEIHE